MSLDTIKQAIDQLSRQDRIALENWLAASWDAEIESDFSPGGPGAAILDQVDLQIDSGNTHRFKIT